MDNRAVRHSLEFNREALSARSDVASAPEPVFLVGSERSGTTLLRLMLDSHPDIAFHMEAEFMVDLLSDDQHSFPDVHEYARRVALDNCFVLANFRIDRSLSYPKLMKSFLEQKRQRDRKPLVGATVHRHFDRLLRIWPNARFIHILRDGRDVARSVVQMGWAGNTWKAVDTWIEAETLWSTLKQQLPPDRFVEVRFEDLVGRPAAELERLCDFLGVRYTPQMFAYAATSTYSLPDKRMAQNWRSSMPAHDVQLVEHKAARLLKERGYEPSGLPALELSRPRQKALALHSRINQFAFRLKRYGVALVLGDLLSRRLKLDGLQTRFRATLNEIDLQYVK